ncbi:hypothetical protein [Paracoccus sp. PARArs4]|uniref:hypothetical protein n=1 Tax=Paracoccus sp. PARArs4 TaxID=2853442 RepID=UPI0024A6A58C|nr:hypothetical protein [Paracoccus sp. PARArs4]
MKFRTLATSAALVTLMGLSPIMSGMATAQEAVELPEALQSLNLTDTTTEEGRRGQRVSGELEDGTRIEAFLNRDGELMGLRADDAVLPEAAIDALLPQAVRDNAIFEQFAEIEGLRLMPEGVEIGGTDADGERVRAAFDDAGRVMRFGRGDHDGRPGKGAPHGDHERGPRGEHRGEHRGGHGGEHRGEHGGEHRGDMRGHGPEGRDQDHGQKGEPRDPQVDEAALAADLSAAGYEDLGTLRVNGRRMTVEATNPQGEEVVLEVTPRGEVVRETAR